MRITNVDINIAGSFISDQDVIKLHENGNLSAHEFYHELFAFDGQEEISTDRTININYTFDGREPCENFFYYFFGLTENLVQPNKVYFKGENIVANTMKENQNIGKV